MKEFKTRQRKAVQTDLDEFCIFAAKDDFAEVTEWSNGEGYDISVCTGRDAYHRQFSLSYGEFKAIKAIIKEMNK